MHTGSPGRLPLQSRMFLPSNQLNFSCTSLATCNSGQTLYNACAQACQAIHHQQQAAAEDVTKLISPEPRAHAPKSSSLSALTVTQYLAELPLPVRLSMLLLL